MSPSSVAERPERLFKPIKAFDELRQGCRRCDSLAVSVANYETDFHSENEGVLDGANLQIDRQAGVEALPKRCGHRQRSPNQTKDEYMKHSFQAAEGLLAPNRRGQRHPNRRSV